MGSNARVVAVRRLVGGITSPVHAVTFQQPDGRRETAVLRRYASGDAAANARLIEREARVLDLLQTSGLPAPRLIAADPLGQATGDVPALLMTRLPGHVHLAPADPDGWLRQVAAILPRIHAVPPVAGVLARHYRTLPAATAHMQVPGWSRQPAAWQAAIDCARGLRSDAEPYFIHADFHHFNLLWQRERLTGIVDWEGAGAGPRDADVGHCRLNLAVLFSAEWAERFRLMYEAEAGRRLDARWDVAALLRYLPGWGSFIQVQAGRRAKVDLAGMHGRVDELMALAAARL
jgi:aminoglycoside phosphotransferase (APT) family kinase protein